MSRERWKVLFQTRHYDSAYRLLGLGWNDFERVFIEAREEGDIEFPADWGYQHRDGHFRVYPFVDDWGHSCRLVEYAVGTPPGELAAFYERIAHELRVEEKVEELLEERHPAEHGLRVLNLAEEDELRREAELLLRGAGGVTDRLPQRCENEECRNLLPNPAPLALYKRACDERRVYGITLYFCSWHCVEIVAAKAKDYLFTGPDA